jgi:hypothetical protein
MDLEARVYAALYLVACELERELGEHAPPTPAQELLAAWRNMEIELQELKLARTLYTC